METKQIWDRVLPSGLRIKEIFNVGLLNQIRLIRQGRKMKYIRFKKGRKELFEIFSADTSHEDQAHDRIRRVDIISAGSIYFDFIGDEPEWYISPFEATSLGINRAVDDTAFFREQFKK